MRKYIKELAGDSLIYGLSGVVTRFISLFLVPIYTRIFTPSDYGVINIVNTTYFLLAIFIVFGLDSAASLWYWDKTEQKDRKKTFASWAYFSFLFSLIVLITIFSFSSDLSVLLFGNETNSFLLDLMGASLVFSSIQKVTNVWFRVRKKAVWAMSFALSVSLTNILLSILFVVKLDFGLRGVYWALLSSTSLGFLISIILMKDWLSPKNFEWSRLKEMIRFSFPLVPAAVSFWLMNSAGTYFINYYISSAEVGLYQLGTSLASALTVASFAFLQAWSPFAFSISKEPTHRQVYADVFILYIYLGGLGLFGVFLFAPEVLSVLAPSTYSGASFVAGLLGLNVIISSLPQIAIIGCSLKKTNMPYSKAVIIGAVLTVILFALLIPKFGKEGAATATIAGNIFIFFYVYKNAQRLYFIPYKVVQAGSYLIGVVSLSILILWISQNHLNIFYFLIKVLMFGLLSVIILIQIPKLNVFLNKNLPQN